MNLKDWKYKRKITIPANSIDSELPYFPCTVYLNEDNFDFTKCTYIDGRDIRFTDSEKNALKFERVEHTPQDVPNVALYEDGDINFDITGGWSKTYNLYGSSGVFTNSEGVLNIANANGSNYVECGCSTVNKIDLTKHDTLAVNIVSNTGYFKLCISPTYREGSNLQSDAQSNGVFLGVKETGKFEVDISDLVGSYYITLWESYTGSTYTSRTATISSVLISTPPAFAKYNVQVPKVSSTNDTEIYMWYGAATKPITYDDLYLYNEGDECLDITGGWIVKASNYTAVAKNSDNLAITQGWVIASIGGAYLYPTKPIDLTDINTITFDYEIDAVYNASGSYSVQLLIGTSPKSLDTLSYKIGYTVTSRTTIDIDVSNITGLQYLCFYGYGAACKLYKAQLKGSLTKELNPVFNKSIEAWQDMTGKAFTYHGDVKLVPDVAKFGKCVYFNGDADYLSVPNSEDWYFGIEDFTIETFINMSESDHNFRICGQRISDSLQWMLVCNSADRKVRLYAIDGSRTCDYRTTTVLPYNKTVHVLCCKKGSNIFIAFGGIMQPLQIDISLTEGEEFCPHIDSVLGIGNVGNDTINDVTLGYMDEFRISKGIARHTSDFEPPTEPYEVDEYTKLLLHFDDYEAMRINSDVANSCYFSKLDIFDNSKTTVVEAELKVNSCVGLIGQRIDVSNGVKDPHINFTPTSVIFNDSTGSPYVHNMDTTDRFHKYKVEVNSTFGAKFYVDDTLITTTPYASLYPVTINRLYFGDGSSSDGGDVDWKSLKYNVDYDADPDNFVEWTPISLPTSQGWTTGGSGATLVFKDEIGKEVTTHGDVKPVKTAYADGARSAYFDGSGDYFTLNSEDDFKFGYKDFCIEATVMLTTTGTYQTIYDGRPLNTNGAYNTLRINPDNTIVYVANNIKVIASTTTITTNHVYKIAVSRHNNVTKLFVNGVQEGSDYMDNTSYLLGESDRPVIGTTAYDITTFLKGNILGMRVTKDRARYTSNYTPPTKFEIDGDDVVLCTNFDTIYDQNYAMIQHMGDTLVDATGNGNNGTNGGTTVIDTEFGKARSFIAGNRIKLGKSGITSDWTALVFGNWTDSGTSEVLLDSVNYVQGETALKLEQGTGNKVIFTQYGYGDYATTIDSPYNTDACLVATRTNNLRFFLEGLYRDSLNVSAECPMYYINSSATSSAIGKFYAVRLSSIARSDAWVKAESLALRKELVIISGELTNALKNSLFFGMNF